MRDYTYQKMKDGLQRLQTEQNYLSNLAEEIRNDMIECVSESDMRNLSISMSKINSKQRTLNSATKVLSRFLNRFTRITE